MKKQKIEEVEFKIGMRVLKEDKVGVVIAVDSNYGYIKLYDRYVGDWCIELDDEGEVELIGYKPEVDTVVEGMVVDLLQLMDEGWTIGSRGLDIKPYLDKLAVAREIQKICNGQ